jgi:hypothetical protein
MISDRDKMVLLVVELLPRDIDYWRKIDDEVRQLRDNFGRASVTVRYYQYWTGRKERAEEEEREAEEIRLREREEARDERGGRGLPMPLALTPSERIQRAGAALAVQAQALQSLAERFQV